MKKYGVVLLLMLALGCISAKADVTGFVLCDALTVRESPDKSARALGSLPYGSTFAISEEQGAWWRIYGPMEGWVDGTYALKQPEYIVTDKEVPVFPTAALSGKRVGLVPPGTSLAVIERQSTCLVVSLRGGSGYIAMRDGGVPLQDNLEPNYGTQYYASVNAPGNRVSLRESASTDARVMAQVPHHALVGVISQTKSWSFVVFDNRLGYIMNQYLNTGETVATPDTAAKEYTANAHFSEVGYAVQAYMLEVLDGHYEAWVRVTIDSGTHLRRFPTAFKLYLNGIHASTLVMPSGETWEEGQCLFIGQFTYAQEIHNVKVVPHVGGDWNEDWEQDAVYLTQP